MRDFGYVQGKDFVMEWRFAEGDFDAVPALATGLVRSEVDIIVVTFTGGAKAVQQATKTIPIVVGYTSDPVGNGLVSSLRHPGGNTTGLATLLTDMSPKHVELLLTVVPHLSRMAVLWNPSNSGHTVVLDSAQAAAREAGVKILPVKARTFQEIENSFATAKQEQTEALLLVTDPLFNSELSLIADLSVRHRLPTIHANREYPAAGGLMSYGDSLVSFFRRAAYYVDRIIKGARPGDLPMEQPTRFSLVINLKTAKSLGLEIPPTLLARADEVIE
jgi:putative ABC transport system substrate-binding protein